MDSFPQSADPFPMTPSHFSKKFTFLDRPPPFPEPVPPYLLGVSITGNLSLANAQRIFRRRPFSTSTTQIIKLRLMLPARLFQESYTSNGLGPCRRGRLARPSYLAVNDAVSSGAKKKTRGERSLRQGIEEGERKNDGKIGRRMEREKNKVWEWIWNRPGLPQLWRRFQLGRCGPSTDIARYAFA